MGLTIARVREIVQEELAKGGDPKRSVIKATKTKGTVLKVGMVLEGVDGDREDYFVVTPHPGIPARLLLKSLTRKGIGWGNDVNTFVIGCTDKNVGEHFGGGFEPYRYTVIFDPSIDYTQK